MRETVLIAGDLQRQCVEKQLSLELFGSLKNIMPFDAKTLMLQHPGNQPLSSQLSALSSHLSDITEPVSVYQHRLSYVVCHVRNCLTSDRNEQDERREVEMNRPR